MSAIAPGGTIGILGGGQLGRMTAMAARSMGFSVHVLDPDPHCPARYVADRCITASFDDADAAADLARNCDVVTLEIEQIGVDALAAAKSHAPVRPGAAVLAIIQDRASQKRWLREHGHPIGEYADVTSAADIQRAVETLGPVIVKATRGGYDGRSQVRVATAADAAAAWEALGHRPAVAERTLQLRSELSIMVARRPSGDMAVYPPSLNHHERLALAWSVMPAPLPDMVVAQATKIARGIAASLEVEGLLAVELFLTDDDRLLVNELAPRPHNSFHQTEAACATSQFEQLVRAVCDLPLGDPSVLRPAAIVNLFGDLWNDGAPPFDRVLREPGVRLHLYGKWSARPGRKMGHISATGSTAQKALRCALEAYARLTT
ncbi:MAG TPA: 5-(carboxyamino)imidazole ribonucleotide synthase [Gemmatimonadaceae bacterium]|nr:5-(carboxyamino)imidazole ribonucleotide synthase [Gemmatimonadaceae bacterium]